MHDLVTLGTKLSLTIRHILCYNKYPLLDVFKSVSNKSRWYFTERCSEDAWSCCVGNAYSYSCDGM